MPLIAGCDNGSRAARGNKLRRVRQSTEESIFDILIHRYILRRVNMRSQAGAYKTMLFAAVA